MPLLYSLLKRQFLCFIFISSYSLAAEDLAGSHVSICDDEAEWPPMTYYLRDGERKTHIVAGYSVELLTSIFDKHQISWDVSLLPWSRCLHEVKKGEQFQMLLNAVSNTTRRQDYLFSLPHFVTWKQYFYSKLKYPQGLSIDSVEDLKAYTLGGVYGYDHSVYGLEEKHIMYRAKSYPHLMQMLYLDRFDIFLAGSGIVAWYRKTRPDLAVDEKLGYAPLTNMPGTPFHFMLSKQWRGGSKLQQLINKEMHAMQQNGELQKLQDKYLR